MIDTYDWTYGAEHEWADWPLDRPLPPGYGMDRKDITIVNSNGVANDPKGRLYRFGGEINTPPTQSPRGQVECLEELKTLYPEAQVNYRSNLHVHVRIPGLVARLARLKRIQWYVHQTLPTVLAQIEPLPRPEKKQYQAQGAYQGELRRWKRRRVSHQTLLTEKRLSKQLDVSTVDEFFRAEVPVSRQGRPMWHCQPRLCVNLRQLRETDTVEFRHFPGTLDPFELTTCVEWCRDFLVHALENEPVEYLLRMDAYQTGRFPAFPYYLHWREERYRRTVHDGTVSKEDIAANIRDILEEDGA